MVAPLKGNVRNVLRVVLNVHTEINVPVVSKVIS